MCCFVWLLCARNIIVVVVVFMSCHVEWFVYLVAFGNIIYCTARTSRESDVWKGWASQLSSILSTKHATFTAIFSHHLSWSHTYTCTTHAWCPYNTVIIHERRLWSLVTVFAMYRRLYNYTYPLLLSPYHSRECWISLTKWKGHGVCWERERGKYYLYSLVLF